MTTHTRGVKSYYIKLLFYTIGYCPSHTLYTTRVGGVIKTALIFIFMYKKYDFIYYELKSLIITHLI